MKRIILTVLLCQTALFGFSQLAEKHTGAIQLGYGYPSVMGSVGKLINFSAVMADDSTSRATFTYKPVGPVHMRFDYMLSKSIGIGLSSNFEVGRFTLNEQHLNSSNKVVSNKYYFDYNSINLMARATFHFLKKKPRLDIYYAHSIGLSFSKVKLDADFLNDSYDADQQFFIDEFNSYMNSVLTLLPIAMEGQFGVKYALTPYVGFYMEAGYSKSFFQLGFFGKVGRSKYYSRSDWRYY